MIQCMQFIYLKFHDVFVTVFLRANENGEVWDPCGTRYVIQGLI